MVNRAAKEIICTAHAEGKMHDFKLFETSVGSDISVQGDSGFQGMLKLHSNSETPHKKPKGGELTAEQKAYNKRLSRTGFL